MFCSMQNPRRKFSLLSFLRSKVEEALKCGADFNPRGHWNPKAHALGAQCIREFLIQNPSIFNRIRPGASTQTRN
jgi:hypothetical protein